MIKNILILCATLLIGCGTSTCKNTESTPPIVPDPVPTVQPDPEPAPEAIKWLSPPEVLELVEVNPHVCLMAYFPDVIHNDVSIELKIFSDPEFIRVANEMFVTMKLPMTPENVGPVMTEFKLGALPALILVPGHDKFLIQIEGNVPLESLLKTINEESKEGKLLESCAEEKNKL